MRGFLEFSAMAGDTSWMLVKRPYKQTVNRVYHPLSTTTSVAHWNYRKSNIYILILLLIWLTLSLPDQVILLCLMPCNITCHGRASGWEKVNWTYSICPSLFLNPFSPRPDKTIPFLILLTNAIRFYSLRESLWVRKPALCTLGLFSLYIYSHCIII